MNIERILTNREARLTRARLQDLSAFFGENYPVAPVGYSDLQIIRCDVGREWTPEDQLHISDTIEKWCVDVFGEGGKGNWLRLPYFGKGVCIFRVWGVRRADFMIRWYQEIVYEPEWLY